MALLARLSAALLALPLFLCRPFMRAGRARDSRERARKERAALVARNEPIGAHPTPLRRPSSVAMKAMRDELRRELVRHAAEGRTFGHLARFERKFSQLGLRAIEQIPVDQLRRALAEFEAMVRNWSSPALADLRSRMAVRLADRSSASTMWIAVNSIGPANTQESMATRLARSTASAAFRVSQHLSVGEVSLSHFEAAGGSTTS